MSYNPLPSLTSGGSSARSSSALENLLVWLSVPQDDVSLDIFPVISGNHGRLMLPLTSDDKRT
jgi:hypothetical protein